MAQVEKSNGTTDGERYLAALCSHSFLSLWNYSNPYTDDGKCADKPTSVGKELCDQLVVFGNHVLIFSDKDCHYPDTPDPVLNWTRYFRKAIWKSAAQMWRAEKWLREFPNRLFEDSQCHKPLTFLPSPENMIVHRILVAHGVAQACQLAYGGTGSLVIDNRIVGEAHFDTQQHAVKPFCIGHLNPAKGYVHVFDDASLLAVMQALDTITDFVEYLAEKEALLTRPQSSLWAAGEDDLLAYYLTNTNETEGHCFPAHPPFTRLIIEENFWDRFLNSPEFTARREADAGSYSWDGLIEFFARNLLANNLYHTSDPDFSAQELNLRLLAQESRLARRMLTDSFRELMMLSSPDKRAARSITTSGGGGICYVFFLLPLSDFSTEEEYRVTRMATLRGYCLVQKQRCFGQFEHIVGIATEAGGLEAVLSFDITNVGGTAWLSGELEEARYWQSDVGLFRQVNEWKNQINEYPTESEGA